MRPFLRDRPTHEMLGQIDALTVALEQADPADVEKRARLLGLRGDLLRILGRTDEALADVRQALELTQVDDLRVRHRIRLGTTLFYAGEHAAAQPELERALEAAQALGEERLVSFAHQHLGKCLAEAGQAEAARDQFEAALAIRERLGLDELASASRHALEALDARA